MRAVRILAIGAGLCLVILGLRWAGSRMAEPERPPSPVQVRVVQEDPAAGASAPDLPRPVQRGERVPDARLVGHDGQEFRLRDLQGSVLVLGFIYTHCEMASQCPLTTTLLAQAYRQVQERQIDVRFLVVSFDPERDTPERLREYASQWKLDVPGFSFATGTPEEVGRLSRALSTYYRRSTPGVFDHNTVVSVVDRGNILHKAFMGATWTPDQLVAAIENATTAAAHGRAAVVR